MGNLRVCGRHPFCGLGDRFHSAGQNSGWLSFGIGMAVTMQAANEANTKLLTCILYVYIWGENNNFDFLRRRFSFDCL